VLRRTLVRAALTGGILGLVIPPAAAQQKMLQADAEYQDRPKNGLTCARVQPVPQSAILRDRRGRHQPRWLVQIFRFAGLKSAPAIAYP